MTTPLGELEPVSALAAEYANGGEVFQQKISQLCYTYKTLRRTRGDGNCFFRAFMFSFLQGTHVERCFLFPVMRAKQPNSATGVCAWDRCAPCVAREAAGGRHGALQLACEARGRWLPGARL
jgi:hypothetical protein